MTKDLTIACMPNLPEPNAVTRFMITTHTTLKQLEASEKSTPAVVVDSPLNRLRENPMASITKNIVTCLECGTEFKSLGRRHLWGHGLTPQSYREKYGFQKRHPLMAHSAIAKKREIALRDQPWLTAHQGRVEEKPQGPSTKRVTMLR